MTQRDMDLHKGWCAARNGEPRMKYASAAWLEGYRLWLEVQGLEF